MNRGEWGDLPLGAFPIRPFACRDPTRDAEQPHVFVLGNRSWSQGKASETQAPMEGLFASAYPTQPSARRHTLAKVRGTGARSHA